ncbi:hypothetical protein N3K66_009064 [Trichothecium roseum]|uniref:Uncharacterized protein n=1 Tax=Trichothecium roseum TaxID=47278 RepID=A0ACC0UQG7_9HYPO|nr:hypothetical protein N3K66_009064 [Trichothecium roseum]
MALSRGLELGHLLESGQYSDLKLICENQEIKVHKMVVCTQSSVLAAAVEGAFEEAKTGVIRIQEFKVETVRQMVQFLYNGEYNDQFQDQDEDTYSLFESTDNNISTPVENLAQHIRANAIADYYDIDGLAELSRKKVQYACQHSWNPESFLYATKEALVLTGDKSLHEVMALAAAQNLQELTKFDHLAELITEFGVQVLRKRIEKAEVVEEELHDKIMQLQTELDYERNRRKTSETREDRVLQNIRRCVRKLQETERCRNSSCWANFLCYIEEHGQVFEPTFTLRCANCRCRHPL